ncbi:mRNA interferase MazF [Algoriphagus locisalis]|uniref:mRNA interferase MazF n=1 Tax=Algoriphagus locisalis TaxID=305507 RepID=A0A1I7E097_9BACT|nr:type II toxin-antitoxin system PemK/MazF family toxin [Algoriphagus locisalis]SFU17382.1 mRNA interferase MazF [Algoriphagus locisalis]
MSIPSKTESPFGIKHKVVLVPFPFEDFSTKKVRPALCLSGAFGNYDHVILAFISSKTGSQPEETEMEIDPEQTIWVQSGLIVKSVLKLHKLVSFPKNMILRELGSFPPSKSQELEEKLKLIIGIK